MNQENPADDQTIGVSRRPRRRPRAAAVAGGTALAIGLGAGGYGIAAAASTPAATSATTLAASSSGSPPSAASGLPRARPAGPRALGPGGLSKGGWLGPRRGLVGLVTGIGSGSLTLQTPDGTTVVVKVTSATTYRTGSQTISLSQLRVDEDVAVAPTSASAGTKSPVAATVAVVGPTIAGRVVAVSGSTITVADAQGFYRTVVTSSATTVTKAGSASSLDAISTGSQIAAVGTLASGRTDLDATSIRILLPRVAGTVSAVDTTTGTITLTERAPGSASGTTVQVTTTAATTFRSGKTTTTLGAIPTGAHVVATGTPSSGNRFAAVEVDVLATGAGRSTGPGGRWHDGGRPFGPGGPLGPGGPVGGGSSLG